MSNDTQKSQNSTRIPNADFESGFRSFIKNQPVQNTRSNDKLVEDTERCLLAALKSYHLNPQVIGRRLTPNGVIIVFKGSDCFTADKVNKKLDTLYTTHGLQIMSVVRGPGTITLTLSREDRQVLSAIETYRKMALPENAPHYNTSFVIGEREDNGELLWLNLTKDHGGQPVSGPHTLICGESGGGKGVLTSSLLLQICATNSPQMAKIYMIDPKSGVDYPFLENMPHLAEEGVITDMGTSEQIYGELIMEMERRYEELLRPTRSRDLDAYNETVPAEEAVGRIYVCHDELADWMGDDQYRKDVGSMLARLSAKGRACGIHLILVTQRPDKKSLPGSIKANMANKIALRVANKVNSALVLDESGAEELLGQGHMLAIIGGMPGRPIYAQAPFLDDWDSELMSETLKVSDETSNAENGQIISIENRKAA